MKIGILTYHRSHNYGALLQAIALRKVLEDMGHEATFVDYWPAYHRHMYKLFSWSCMMDKKKLRQRWRYAKNCAINCWQRKKRRRNFAGFISAYITPYLSGMDEQYDVIVHGSDQIWRKQPEMNTYNPVYFGKHDVKALRKVTYAASMGIMPESVADRDVLRELIGHLDDVSVRERDLKELVSSLGYGHVSHDLDPTLLLSEKSWVSMFKLEKTANTQHYVLYYRLKDSFDMKMVREFAQSRGLALKVVYGRADGKDTSEKITTANPLAFLQLIYGADFVFTSSFHGLAFALIFHKPFLASFTTNAGRAASILGDLGLSDHLVSPKTALPEKINDIDYGLVDKKLEELRTQSMDFLLSIEKGR